MNDDVCYVGCFFTGERGKRAKDQGTHLIYEHVAALKNTKTTLITSFVFVINVTDPPIHEFDDEFMAFMGATTIINGVPITWHVRPNVGISYGAFISFYLKNTVKHDWYIFIEDDYVPCTDDFDSKLVTLANDTSADYMCSLADHYSPKWGLVASISNGIINDRVLSGTLGVFKEQGHTDIATVDAIRDTGQRQFSKMITGAGFKITDMMAHYGCQFYEGGTNVQGTKDNRLKRWRFGHPEIFMPIQVLRGDTFDNIETMKK
jgi:hypothetical protein